MGHQSLLDFLLRSRVVGSPREHSGRWSKVVLQGALKPAFCLASTHSCPHVICLSLVRTLPSTWQLSPPLTPPTLWAVGLGVTSVTLCLSKVPSILPHHLMEFPYPSSWDQLLRPGIEPPVFSPRAKDIYHSHRFWKTPKKDLNKPGFLEEPRALSHLPIAGASFEPSLDGL